MDSERILAAFSKVRGSLLAKRVEKGHWIGELSSSPLSTATAVTALTITDRVLAPNEPRYRETVKRGLRWIIEHANPDGGWGDTDLSRSNISTTVLCWSALAFGDAEDPACQTAVEGAEAWLSKYAGGTEPYRIAEAVTLRYGKDKTFSVPILTMAALAGRLGAGRQAWQWVKPLPFELAAFPRDWYAGLKLPVVSYALPALIAIGIARHTHLPSRSPIWRGVRATLKPKCMSILNAIQPENGGFLEATPLTSFVAMSLASSRLAGHPVTLKAVEFIVNSVRPDGSWAIDTNLSTWVSTLAVNALGEPGLKDLEPEEKESLYSWIKNQQYLKRHPYTRAEPGGWSWTPLPGGVPDSDDTAGALVAMHHFWSDEGEDADRRVAKGGSNWLYRLQNQDGGMPTFCKGWGHLPFDRSSPDISAHAIRAWTLWIPKLMPNDQYRAKKGLKRALDYLLKAQRGDGTWSPLWFGNQEVPEDENPTYGTARVVIALSGLPEKFRPKAVGAIRQAIHWLILNQNDDGGWGGGFGTTSSVEETALAIEALFACQSEGFQDESVDERWLNASASKGLGWLVERVENDEASNVSPIGFYFAKLWYYEKLYPLVFTAGALRRAMEVFPVPVIEEESAEEASSDAASAVLSPLTS
jgi:squalene-hopene/tetraprenyl-beta-curcumene cyclase